MINYHRGAPPQRCNANEHSRFDTTGFCSDRRTYCQPEHERCSAKIELQAGKPEPNSTRTPAGGPSGPPCRPYGDGAVPPGRRAPARRCRSDGGWGGSLALGGHHRRWPLLRGGGGGALLPWQHCRRRAGSSRALSASGAWRGGPEATGGLHWWDKG